MAVEVNTRKRKHKSDEDGNDDAIPKKIAKTGKSPKFKKAKKLAAAVGQNGSNGGTEELAPDTEAWPENGDGYPEDGEGFAENEAIADAEEDLKFSKDFKMYNFRTKLRGSNFITELRHFLHLAEARPKIIAKYIEKRGKPLELAEALERIDKANVLHVGYICDALQQVLLWVLSNEKTQLESAVNACRYFLKTHGALLEHLLRSPRLQHRRIALKLMTAIVCVDPQLGRQLLGAFDILSNAQLMKKLLSHSMHEVHAEETVRKCFIHFVLAFLVDDNLLLKRNILDRGPLIAALLSDLVYDDPVTVSVVLSSLRKYVLQSSDISKTKKVHIFSLECCKSLVRLYDWQGPQGLSKGEGKADGGTVDPEELETVSSIAHEFLVELLTSRKHGIAFVGMTNFRQKHNSVQGKLIGSIRIPWSNEKKVELILSILRSCPDLARSTVRHFANIVDMARTAQVYWVKAANFLRQIIETMHPRLLKNSLDQFTLTDYLYWMKGVCLPLETLSLLNGGHCLRNKSFQHRLATNRLLYAMFAQYSNYMAALTKRESAKGSGANSMRRLKFDILNHILMHFSTVEEILFSLFKSIETRFEPEVDVLEHLNVTLDLVLVIAKENRSFLNRTSTILDYLSLLRPLYAADHQTPEGNSGGNIRLELKAIKTILLLYPQALEPRSELFENVVKSFIHAFLQGDPIVRREAGQLLRSIFKNTGIFESCELEIDLWLEALHFFKANTAQVVTSVFIEVLRVTQVEAAVPTPDETSTNTDNLRRLFANIEQGFSVQAYVESLALSKLMPLIFKGVEIVPPLCTYLEVVLLLMFHYYPTPEYVRKLYEMEFTTQTDYMRQWLTPEGDPPELPAPLAKGVPCLKTIQAAILSGQRSFEDIFECSTVAEASASLVLGEKTIRLQSMLENERFLMIYVQQAVFLVAQLVHKRLLTRPQAESAADFVIRSLQIVQQLEAKQREDGEQDESSDSFMDQMLQYIFSVRISFIRSVELFSVADETHLNYLHFLRKITEHCNELPNFSNYATNYRLKIVKSVAISLQNVEETKAQSERLSESLKLLQSFRLDMTNCVEILELLGEHLKYGDFFVNSNQRSIFYDLVVVTLQRLAAFSTSVKCDSFVRKFIRCYPQFFKKLGGDLNLEPLEEAFYNFLLVSHQYLPELGGKFFECFFVERKLSKTAIKLATLQLDRVDELLEDFLRLLPEHMQKKELVYPLLKVAFQKPQLTMDAGLLQQLFQTYKSGFMKTIEKPQKAGVIYKDHVDASIALIDLCMPRSECVDFCNKNFKFDNIEVFQMRVLNAIYAKAFDSLAGLDDALVSQRQNVFVNYVHLQTQMLTVELKKSLPDLAKVELFAFMLQQWWRKCSDSSSAESPPDFGKILRSQQWLIFCKSCLKVGMQGSENVADFGPLQGLLFKLLAYLCDQLYKDWEQDSKSQAPSEPAQLFELICTHSRFFEIVLQHRECVVKTQVLHALFILAKKSPVSLRSPKCVLPISVVLGAYQARLTDTDRYALALLQLFEVHDPAAMKKYRPYIWGESAIAFYALRDAEEERTKLTQQETSIAQVMSLINRHACDYTLCNFPIWRKLDTLQQMPASHFADPAQKMLAFGANALERRIESGATTYEDLDLRLCPKREGVYEACYDPAFFVPLLSFCFAPETYAHPARPVENGLLAMSFAALSAQDKELRLAAGCAQLRYRAHFEQKKFFERPLWTQAYDNIQAGLSELRDAWQNHKRRPVSGGRSPRVPFIPALFVAKTLNVTTEPTHLLYKQLTMYLRLKSSFNFQCVPEFNILFYSPEVEHHSFRQFIVEVIRDGIKCGADLFLLVTTNTFKVLMGFYGSTMSTLEMNLSILSVFSTCVKIPASTKTMIEYVGVLPWLSSIISGVEFHQFDVIEGLISVINNLWYALKASEAQFHNFSHLRFEIHRQILLLLPHLSGRISMGSLSKFLNVLWKTAESQFTALSSERLDNLIGCAQKHFDVHVESIEGIRRFGGAGAASHADYCRQLRSKAPDLDLPAILALSSLRAYVMEWWRHQTAPTAVPVEVDPNVSSV